MSSKNQLQRTKIHNAEKYYKQWEDRFKSRQLEEYWEGYQWRQIIDLPYYKPYVVNLIYAELKKKLANILYQNLAFNMTPRPGHYSSNPEFAFQVAQNKQDFTNELIARANIDNDFNDSIKLCAMDSFFRFGVMEVGYAADWRNPVKTPPLLTSHDNSDISDDKATVVEDEEVPENERIYFKRIKASRFRISVSDDSKLSHCSWCGYFSYIYKSALTKSKAFKLPGDFDSNDAGYNAEYIGASKSMDGEGRAGSTPKEIIELLRQGKVYKVWNIWDNESHKRKLILDPSYETIWEGDFYRLPFATHRHDLRLDGWYPVPPIYHWLAPQDEINQAREQMRNYRRRFTRKYTYWGVDQEEIEKFKSETDGEVIKLKNPNSSIAAISNPEIGITIVDGLNASRDDFNIVSGSSSDLTTAQSDRTSATQSKITAMKAQIIESVEQLEFTKFYQKIGRLALLEGQEKFTAGLWVKQSADPFEKFLGQINSQRMSPFKYITSQDLSDGFDVDIEISCINASPAKMQEEFEKYVKFLTMVNQFPQIAMSPDLIRETAYRVGYRNEKIIAEMQKMAMLTMLGQTAQAAQASGSNLGQMLGGPNANNGANGNMVRNAAPSSQEAIDQQLLNQ